MSGAVAKAKICVMREREGAFGRGLTKVGVLNTIFFLNMLEMFTFLQRCIKLEQSNKKLSLRKFFVGLLQLNAPLLISCNHSIN